MMLKIKLFIFLFFSFAQVFAQEKSIYEIKVEALKENGQQEKIIPYLQAELETRPKNENLLRLIGFQYLQINNLEMGEKYYREALVVNPACARCYLNIGRIYVQKNDFGQALNYLDKALAIEQKDDLLFSNRAQIKEVLGDKLGALADHNRAIELSPKNSNAYTERGIYNLKQGDKALALADFNQAINLDPDNYFPYFYRSRIKFESNDLDGALMDINKAIELDAQQYQLYNFRGTIYQTLKQLSRALEEYSNAIKLNPNGFLAYFNRAEVYYELENMDASCQDYAQAKALVLKEKINDPVLFKNIEDAILDFCDTSKAGYYYQRGVAFYNLKEYEKALVIYDSGLQKFPKNAMILSFKGNTYLALKDYKNAGSNFETALDNKASLLTELEYNPRFAGANKQELQSFYNGSIALIYYNNAECKMYNEKLEDALIDINQAIALVPNTADFNKESFFNRRGNIYLDMNRHDLAKADFSQSIQLNKNYAPAYISMAIAKITGVQTAKRVESLIRVKLPNQPFRINLGVKPKISSHVPPDIISALEDCNKAIELDGNMGFAYYVRGQIKLFLGYADYCTDLIKAQEMGIEIEKSLLVGCK